VIVDGDDYFDAGPASIRYEAERIELQAQLRARTDDEGWLIFLRLDDTYMAQIIDTRMEERAATLAEMLGHTEFTTELLEAFGSRGHATADLTRLRPETPAAPVLTLVPPEPAPAKPKHLTDPALIAKYVTHLQRRNLSPRSIEAVESRLRTFTRANRGTFGTVTRAGVEAILDKRNLSPRTRYWWISMLSGFYTWAIDEELLEVDPTAKITRPNLKKTLPRPMTDADLRRALYGGEPMMRCWLLLGAYEGLRCQEIAGVSREDVDEDAMTLRVVYGKGAKERMLPLHADVLEALRALPMPARGPLFRRSRCLDRYPPYAVSQELNDYLRGLGIKSSAHTLRHYFASNVYAATLDLRLTQELMGHESADTTAIYTKADMGKGAGAVASLKVK